MRVSVKGDILAIDGPSSTWTTNFERFPKFEVRIDTLPHSSQSLR